MSWDCLTFKSTAQIGLCFKDYKFEKDLQKIFLIKKNSKWQKHFWISSNYDQSVFLPSPIYRIIATPATCLYFTLHVCICIHVSLNLTQGCTVRAHLQGCVSHINVLRPLTMVSLCISSNLHWADLWVGRMITSQLSVSKPDGSRWPSIINKAFLLEKKSLLQLLIVRWITLLRI